MSDTQINYRYLNLANQWPAFTLTGLVIAADGALTLPLLPQAQPASGGASPVVAALAGPAGIGTDADGNLYIADPAGNRILRWDSCLETSEPLPCFGGAGSLPGQLNTPRGVLVGPRDALYVADSGNNRIQIVDLATLQLRGIWGQTDSFSPPVPSAEPGCFNTPYDLAADSSDSLYVVDYGNRRVQKFNADGRVMPEFATTLQAQPTAPVQPTFIAVAVVAGGERLLILDSGVNKILVYQTDGVFDAAQTALWNALPINQPAGIAFVDGTLYVGDVGANTVVMFDESGAFLGAVPGYSGPVSGLEIDRRGRLLVHPGDPGAIVSFLPAQTYASVGSFVAGPFAPNHVPSLTDPTPNWYRVRALVDGLDTQTHIQFYTCTQPVGQSPPALPVSPPVPQSAPEPVGSWSAAPRDQHDFLIQNAPATCLWIGAILTSQGTATPRIQQIRIEFDHVSLSQYLPAIYRTQETSAFLEQLLGLLESVLATDEQRIDTMARLLDAAAAPDSANAPWLDWLSGWLDFSLQETWTEPERRQALANAFALYGLRGTREGLIRLISLYAGVTARITEPFQQAGLWSLGAGGLGFDSMLAPGPAYGAVAGTTAFLDQSLLISDEEFGAPLFQDIAYCFNAQFYQSDIADPTILQKVTQVLDLEKPAHTNYHLCLLKPRMRVGFQARVGIDTIVAGPPHDLTLGGTLQLGVDTLLTGTDRPATLGNARLDRETPLR